MMLASCREGGKYRHMKEGEIYYAIRYIHNSSTISKELMPKELVISFRNDLIATRLKAPVGNLGVSTVINPAENVYDTYLNILSFRYCFEGNEQDIQPGFQSMAGIRFRETGKKSIICGFNCHEVMVELPGSDSVRYIWYTNEIDVENPNRMTPYKDIKGVLMEFFYIIGGAEMQFTADEVLAKKIPDKEFEKKKNYRKVSSRYLDTLISKMISF